MNFESNWRVSSIPSLNLGKLGSDLGQDNDYTDKRDP